MKQTQSKSNLSPFKIAVIYAVAGGLWILFSDRILASLIQDPHILTRLQTYKGWGFVVVTALLVYGLIRNNIDRILEASQRATVLTQSLLAFSRKQTINLTLIDLNELIRRFEKFLLRLLRESIELKILLNSPSPPPSPSRGEGYRLVPAAGLEDVSSSAPPLRGGDEGEGAELFCKQSELSVLYNQNPALLFRIPLLIKRKPAADSAKTLDFRKCIS